MANRSPPVTGTGTLLSGAVPLPMRPSSLNPQQYATLSPVSPHTWPPPRLSALNCNPPDTLTGTLESIVDPFPREMPWPQQYAVPVAVVAQATLPAPVRIASGITMSNGALLADESPGAIAT